MKQKYRIIMLLLVAGCLAGCNDWLDVSPDTEVKEKDLFVSVKGFQDALTGCYMQLASNEIYGERLTMSNIESLANLWFMNQAGTGSMQANWYLKRHEYGNDYARTAIQSIYGGLYNTIAQANMIIANINETRSQHPVSRMRDIIEAEAYGIRAFCHLDVLRLFGQMPQGGTRMVMLPYSESASIKELPPYYSHEEFVRKLEADFEKALSLLKDKDPLFDYTFAQLNSADYISRLDDGYLAYRQFRMNYWAITGLQARMYLYLGQTDKAYRLASSIIGAKGADGQTLMPLSGMSDISNGYYALPSECLLALSKHNLITYSVPLLVGSSSEAITPVEHLLVSSAMLGRLYQGQNIASNNRYLNVWNRNVQTASGTRYPAIMKYYYNAAASNLMTKRQLIPLLRMSEIYLIAMETTPDISEANALYRKYMEEHNDLVAGDKFQTKDDVLREVVDEYRREFYAEGQMFYTYKRTNATSMLWRAGVVGEEQYIVPLPDTEFNPNEMNN